jgi:proteasome lid subunit RPN8/RPN11
MRISPEQHEAVVDHARAEHPNECCGVLVVRDGAVVAVHALENVAASPFRFEVDGMELHRLLTEVEDAGDELGAIYHSHTRSEPYPSQTDVNFAAHWPGVEWLIVGLPGRDAPAVVRSYRIESGAVDEVPVDVTDG